ncbi:MAG: hypothetical protein NZ853_10170 [Leptospiraceae bacterium]|nr:hypothetical protein [Leptospiraceae bacterium]MDW7974978.1 hypothetical protein [Leptospiraceae bacterium]
MSGWKDLVAPNPKKQNQLIFTIQKPKKYLFLECGVMQSENFQA